MAMGRRLKRIAADAIPATVRLIAETAVTHSTVTITPPATAPMPAKPERGPTAESTNVSYCLECENKHLNTAKVLLREAIQRAEAREPTAAVLEKVRGVAVELAGAEDDSNAPTAPSDVRSINAAVRDLRKRMWVSGLEVEPKLEGLKETYRGVDGILTQTYEAAGRRRAEMDKVLAELEKQIKSTREDLQRRGEKGALA